MESGELRPLPALDQPSTLPSHARIERWLAGKISEQALRPGDKLPVEGDIAAALGVSRATLRQAWASLEARGVLHRRRGRGGGTFVAEPKIDCDLTGLHGFTEQICRTELGPGAQVVSAATVPAAPGVATALNLARGDDVHEVIRIRWANGEPLALEHSYFPGRPFPGFLAHALTGSIYELMGEVYGQGPHTAEESLEPIIADSEVAARLEVAVGSPVMLIERTAFTVGGLAVEFARDIFRSDRVRITLRTGFHQRGLSGPGQGQSLSGISGSTTASQIPLS
jgi:GntR family transcriptional regulator